jgi:hypothetical protein
LVFKKKNGKKSSNLGCKMVKTKMVLEDVGVRENGAKVRVA